jgi:hypothetical protein
MKNSWQGTLTVLVLFVACVLGCSKSNADVPKTLSDANKTTTVEPKTTTPADISGNYDVTGTNEDGSPYKGALQVIKHGDVYQFRWNAGRQYDGVGVPNGNVVAVAFTEGQDGKGCGVVNYQVLPDGTLDGKWGYWGVNESGSETATRDEGSGLAGDYDVSGKNPNGNGYKAGLTITPRSGGYQFAWSNNTSGFGIKRGSNVSVGIGGPRCAFVAYEVTPSGLDGVWGGYGSDKTGTEKATKK